MKMKIRVAMILPILALAGPAFAERAYSPEEQKNKESFSISIRKH